jgi:diguanylate cyclase (GGDEF)-like protein/PAS domain S-box-containing protein
MDSGAARLRGRFEVAVQSKQANELEAAVEGASLGIVRPGAGCTSCDWALSAQAGAAVRYRSIFHQVPLGIVQTTVENRILEANPHLCGMLGYAAAELRNFTTRDLTHPEDRDKHDHLRQRLLAGLIDRFTAQKRFLRRDGQWIWTNRTVTLARDAANEAPYLIHVIEDITERKRTQDQLERLRRTREVLANCNRALVHAIDEAAMLAQVCRIAVASGGFKQAWIGLVTGDALRPVYVAAHAGYGQDAPPMSSPTVWAADGSYRGKMARVVASGEPCFERDVFTDPGCVDQRQHARHFGWGSSLTMPLAAEGRILGAIEFNARETDAFDSDEIAMLAELAGDLSFGISALRTRLAREQAEAQAREHERRYQETFDQAAMGIVHTSLDGRYLKVNRRFCAMLGYAEDELIGRPAAGFTHPDDQDKGRDFRWSMWEGKLDNFQEQKRYLRKDGTVLWTNRTVSLARDAAGKPMYFIRVIEDITERRSMEENDRATFDNAPVGIMHTAFTDLRILRANRALAEMLGYSEAELLELTSTDLVHPDFRFTDVGKYRPGLVDGTAQSFASERKYLRKDGSPIWVNRTVSLVKDAAGKPDYYIRIIEDISERILSTQRRAMEHAVAKGLAEAATVEEAMPTLIRTMCESAGWCYGTHWCWSDETQTLVRNALWSGNEMAFEPGEEVPWTRLRGRNPGGLIGPAWFEGKPCWIEDMRSNTTFNRRHAALAFGFHSALSFPITADGVTIGIMEFFGRDVRKPDEVLLATVGSIGRQIGQFIQRKQAEQALRTSEERYRDIFESSPLPMLVRDDATRGIITVNQAAVDHYGYTREELLRMEVRDLWDPSEQRHNEGNRRGQRQQHIMQLKRRHVTKDGRRMEIEATARAFELGGRRVWLTVLNDVTERIRAEQKLVHLAHYDVLTGLPNRVLFYERLKQALVQAARNRWITGVMFMDVDRFKNINDTLGHDVGDQLLRQVSERLAASVRASDTVGRLGGDEFAVVLANLTAREDAAIVAQKIMQNFDAPFRLSGSEIFVTISIGITLYPDDGTEQDALIKNADAAMYRAKEEGRNTYRYYTPDMSARALRLLTLEGSLRRALERDEFLLHYQPKAAVASGSITGVEALLRWRHPERGLVPPAEFIPVLEETGLIVQASEWVLNAACRQLVQWRRAGIEPVPVAVNLSAREFLAPDLASTISRILRTHGLDPCLLELEITESSLMVNPDEAARTLEYLKRLGVGLSIDDFGTGYSSLSYLKRFPLDALKVDRSFVRDIPADANDAAITLAVISMAHSLGLKVIAEGVENPAQLAFLAQHGCDQVQGYYLARPVAAEACAGLLQARKRLPAQE